MVCLIFPIIRLKMYYIVSVQLTPEYITNKENPGDSKAISQANEINLTTNGEINFYLI